MKRRMLYDLCWKSGKQRYRAYKDAWAHAQALRAKGEQYVRVYECPDCLGWHVTRKPLR
jgi:hypothetical protein